MGWPLWDFIRLRVWILHDIFEFVQFGKYVSMESFFAARFCQQFGHKIAALLGKFSLESKLLKHNYWQYLNPKMFSLKFCIAAILLIFATTTFCQPEQQQQGATLTREAVEKLLEVLSFECRSEMENALAQQTDVSVECKQEITQAIRTHDIPIQHGGPPPEELEAQENDDESEEEVEKPKKRASEPKLKVKKEAAGGIPPIYTILGFVVVFFGAIAAYIAYVNKARGPFVAQKPKKLSKKKEEKQKQKKEKLNQLN